MRSVILHHHIFKNAGSIFDFTLEMQLGMDVGFATLHASDVNGTVTADQLIDFLNNHPQVVALSSHHFHCQNYQQLLAQNSYRFINAALVRKPLQRILSIYKFFRRSPGEDQIALAARGMDFPDFLVELLQKYPNYVNSPQVNQFINHGFYCRPVSNADVEAACRYYASFGLCGTVERYDHAMVAFEYFCTQMMPMNLNLAHVDQNVSPRIPGEENLHELIGAKNEALIAILNTADEQLGWSAAAGLDRRIELIPNFGHRLKEYHQRCEEMRIGYEEAVRAEQERLAG
jgi:Sulfotransferase family